MGMIFGFATVIVVTLTLAVIFAISIAIDVHYADTIFDDYDEWQNKRLPKH